MRGIIRVGVDGFSGCSGQADLKAKIMISASEYLFRCGSRFLIKD